MTINDFAAGSGMSWNDWFIDFMTRGGGGGSPGREGGIGMGTTPTTVGFAELVDAWEASRSAPVRVAVIGDSLLTAPATLISATAAMSNYLSTGAGHAPAPGSGPFPVDLTGSGGTVNTLTTGMNGLTMGAGVKRTHTATCTGVTVMYRGVASGTGELTIRNGVGGTTIATVSNDEPTGGGYLATTTVLASASRTIEFESTGAGDFVLENVMFHTGNATHGVHVWNLNKTGSDSTNYTNNPAERYRDFFTRYTPQVVIVQLGTSGYSTLIDLIIDIRATLPDAYIVGVVPYKNSSIAWAEIDEIREIHEQYASTVFDMSVMFGDMGTRLFDGVHPDASQADIIGRSLAAIISGNPLQIALLPRNTSGSSLSVGGLTVYKDAATAPTAVWSQAANTLHAGSITDFFLGGAKPSATFGGGTRLFTEQTAPGTPVADTAVMYATSTGVYVKFSDGTVVPVAEKP